MRGTRRFPMRARSASGPRRIRSRISSLSRWNPLAPEAKRDTATGGVMDLALYFLRLGALGFGGPIALVGYMQRDLVEDRKWITKEDYSEGLALAHLSPGPLAAQLSIYLGWVKGGILGSNLVGVAFILPSFLMVVALAVVYLHFAAIPWIQGGF